MDETDIANDKIRVCVFGSSSDKTPKKYLDMAFELGALIAKNNCVCVNGGGMFGVMGFVTLCKYQNPFIQILLIFVVR